MYKKQRSKWLQYIDFIVLDIICMQLSLVFAFIIRYGLNSPYSNALYRNLAIIFILFEVFVISFNDSYGDIMRRGFYVELIAVFKHVTMVVGIALIYLFLTQQSAVYSRIILGVMWVFNIVISWLCRIIWKVAIRKRIVGTESIRSMVLIADRSNAESLLETFVNNNFDDIQISGLIIWDEICEDESVQGIPIVGYRDNAFEYLKNNWVDEVFIDVKNEEQTLSEKCLEMGVVVHTKLAKVAGMKSNQVVENLAGYTVLSRSVAMVTARQLFVKRAMDIIGGIVGCILTVLAFLIIGPIIKIKSPGPVFFKQIRVGKNGRKFTLYKFRSMYMDAEERKKSLMQENNLQDDKMFKMDNDPRIVKGIGTFIRKYSIDELPQFFNVLRGDMSLVGTRPPTVEEWNKYELHHHKRLAIKPGITGLWQTSGRSDITDFEQVVALDTRYIVEWSLGMDLRILCKTIGVVFKGTGAK